MRMKKPQMMKLKRHQDTHLQRQQKQSKNTKESEDKEISEEEIEAFIQSEQLSASEGNNAPIDSEYTPQVGMEFKNRDDAHHYFNSYAFLAGFKVAITHVARTTSRKRNNEITKVTMKCHKHGKELKEKRKEEKEEEILTVGSKGKGPKRNTRVQVKIDCQVPMVAKEDRRIWKIIRLNLDLNHELSPENRNQMFSGHKCMSDIEKGIIRT